MTLAWPSRLPHPTTFRAESSRRLRLTPEGIWSHPCGWSVSREKKSCGSVGLPRSLHELVPSPARSSRCTHQLREIARTSHRPPWPSVRLQRASCARASPPGVAASLGVRLNRPSTVPVGHVHSTAPEGAARRTEAIGSSRSALVVSHHLGGLLRARPCRFVAPRYRSWGSRPFGHRTHPTTNRVARPDPPGRAGTLRRVPFVDSRTASPRPLPPWHST
jgi:hypothetical protein